MDRIIEKRIEIPIREIIEKPTVIEKTIEIPRTIERVIEKN